MQNYHQLEHTIHMNMHSSTYKINWLENGAI